MIKSTLILNNEQEFTNLLCESLTKKMNTKTTVVQELESDTEGLLSHDLYIIRLSKKSEAIIKELSKADKLIIILSSSDTQEVREKILSLDVSDYVITTALYSAKFVAKVAKRLQENAKKNILVVDDSALILTHISMLLRKQNINCKLYSDASEALEYLKDPKSTQMDLVITDYEMPNMSGYELVKHVREIYSFEELPILVLSGSQNTYMVSRFLKAGANDYISKPFLKEEFIGRITNSLLQVSMFNEIKNMAMTDYLTGLYNRVYFYDTAVNMLEVSTRAKQNSAIAMIDIDNFKKINDTYGHEVGDQALIHVANTMKRALRRSDVLIRFGGEEFVILLINCPHDKAVLLMNKVCSLVAKSPLYIDNEDSLKITVSIGVTSQQDKADKMIERADKYMYTAKKSGKNRVYTEE